MFYRFAGYTELKWLHWGAAKFGVCLYRLAVTYPITYFGAPRFRLNRLSGGLKKTTKEES